MDVKPFSLKAAVVVFRTLAGAFLASVKLGRCRFWGRAAAVLLFSGCGTVCKNDHSCPKPGHGPCYLCDEPDIIYGRKDIIWPKSSR